MTARVAELQLHETPRANIANAEMIIASLLNEAAYSMEHDAIDALRSVYERLQAARGQLDEEQQVLGVARLQKDAHTQELRELQQELREAQQLLAEFVQQDVHLKVDWERERYVIEKRYTQTLAEYTDWALARTHLKKLRAEGHQVAQDRATQRALSAGGE